MRPASIVTYRDRPGGGRHSHVPPPEMRQGLSRRVLCRLGYHVLDIEETSPEGEEFIVHCRHCGSTWTVSDVDIPSL